MWIAVTIAASREIRALIHDHETRIHALGLRLAAITRSASWRRSHANMAAAE